MKFLVGFFYFSGLRKLYEALKQNPNVTLKVLVGLRADIINHQLLELADGEKEKGSSNQEIRSKFFDALRSSLNTPQHDTSEFYEQAKFFLKLIQEGRLIIRKTLRPNHAKLYIFKLGSDQVARKTLFITGSSNLTRSGLTLQDEFNVEISDYGYDEAEAYFDRLWAEALSITEDPQSREAIFSILQQESPLREITPFEAYLLVLKSYLDSFEKKGLDEALRSILKEAGYTPFRYQLDAISQAIAILEKYNGVILADVVGLGKTVVACAIARALEKRGVVICPPSLMGDPQKRDAGWHMYLEQFGLTTLGWDVWSRGQLEKLEDALTSGRLKGVEVIIVDEAHYFRNEDTKSYEQLKNICRGKQVILLTATPFNNRPSDIFALLKLFTTPKQTSVTLDDNLEARFRTFKKTFEDISYILKNYQSPDPAKRKEAYARYQALFGESFFDPQGVKKAKQRAKYLAKQIRDVIEPVTIRRNRLDLRHNPEYREEVGQLPKVADPEDWLYELTPEQSAFYDRVIQEYFGDPQKGGKFTGALYRPFEYEAPPEKIKEWSLGKKENFEYQQQRNLCDFMRHLLVHRFESSFGAFAQSVENFVKFYEAALQFIERTKRYVLHRELVERGALEEDAELLEQKLREYAQKLETSERTKEKRDKIYRIEQFARREEFLRDIQADLDLLKTMLAEMRELGLLENDPKADTLGERLKEMLAKEPQRKIVVFSQYRDTVQHLKRYLEPKFGGRLLAVVDIASKSTIETILKNFDASYPTEKQEDAYDILIVTDRFSEGFNLNRAGAVVNYDIPWNPVRVIQRLGRINRIGQKLFNELYTINFFPTEKGNEITKKRVIAANKLFLIHNTLGEDAKIFDVDEEPEPSKLYQRLMQNPEEIEEESFYTKIVEEFEKYKSQHPHLIAQLDKLPKRVKVAKAGQENELLVFFKKGGLHTVRVPYPAQPTEGKEGGFQPAEVALEDVIDAIRSRPDEPRRELSAAFWDAYKAARDFRYGNAMPKGELSREQQARNVLDTLLRAACAPQPDAELQKRRRFLATLQEDITDYGTLPSYTLRRILEWSIETPEKREATLKAIDELKAELGENYLEEEKRRLQHLEKEIIVAIENQTL